MMLILGFDISYFVMLLKNQFSETINCLHIRPEEVEVVPSNSSAVEEIAPISSRVAGNDNAVTNPKRRFSRNNRHKNNKFDNQNNSSASFSENRGNRERNRRGWNSNFRGRGRGRGRGNNKSKLNSESLSL